ncbi:NAD(P)-binding protein [Mannheimia massilioguelmaensis]|uniref:NAD(P)-binding protein n=1 Tax=Mannheimia massilioguelmaensis TaxID=1604354 RepID=UPI0005CB4D91|nr:NAD(P)-binding protein [Mannheimia massilioguelmaensis]
MAKFFLTPADNYDVKIGQLVDKFVNKVRSFPPGTCPLVVQYASLRSSMSQTCGKCVPCRDGIPHLSFLLRDILAGEGDDNTMYQIRELAEMIRDGSDCAIGYQPAIEILDSIEEFKEEYESHIHHKSCQKVIGQRIPCINMCPAHVDIPGYIAHIGDGNYAAAINLIRRDNPLPTACGLVCEHPCEERCRRRLIDDAINIRGLKKYAVDQIAADTVKVPEPLPDTGKKVAVIGGGPAGLTCAYFLAQMGHRVTIYERQKALGGMLRYGIPNYRFPKDRLDQDLNAVLSAGNIEVKYGVMVGDDISVEEIRRNHDAMFVGIGAQKGKILRIDGADANNVFSAVQMLDDIGNNIIPDYTDKVVVVIGGGNVAMDAARSAVRCKAKDVRIVYRRRQEDMTALHTEIEAAIMEGIELITLAAPVKIEKDESGSCRGLTVQPQMTGPYDHGGRPSPVKANKPEFTIDCDVILIAVGQDIISMPFEEFGMPAERGVFKSDLTTAVPDMNGVFVGGDCATGPSTAIKAIAAGKVAAHNIDEYLGYHHEFPCETKAPPPKQNVRIQIGRANITERPAYIRKCDFEHVENPYTYEEAMQEAERCLRCDHFGCGVLQGGRNL